MTDTTTQEQTVALRSLERALRRCHDAGLKLYGMDGNLYWLPAEADDSYEYRLEHAQRIEDHGAYRDSGGW